MTGPNIVEIMKAFAMAGINGLPKPDMCEGLCLVRTLDPVGNEHSGLAVSWYQDSPNDNETRLVKLMAFHRILGNEVTRVGDEVLAARQAAKAASVTEEPTDGSQAQG
jgi:hypothetical protein